MELSKRIAELLQTLTSGVPEREFSIQLGFLATIVSEPFYLFGRSGSGKSMIINRLAAAYKSSKILKIGKRELDIPEDLNSYDMIIFQGFQPLDKAAKLNAHIALEDKGKAALIISGEYKPEVALNQSDLTDKITLTVTLPDSISPNALCTILQSNEDPSALYVPLGVAISPEEKQRWNEEIRKVTLSEDSLYVIAEITKACEKNSIYVPIRKWIALTNIIKAAAFFNGRKETRLTDTFFLGTPIWGKSTSNNIITDSYKEIIRNNLLKNVPDIIDKPYDADDLIRRIRRNLYSSNTSYKTHEFNGKKCVLYNVNVAGETTPLYVPVSKVETDEDFHPFNEWRQTEVRVICNFHGTSSCSISIDKTAKANGLRSFSSRNNPNNGLPKKYELYGTLPTQINCENDNQLIALKQQELIEIRKEIQSAAEHETKNLQVLREVFANIRKSKDDMFCHKEFFNSIQEQVSELFEKSKAIIEKIKEAHKMLPPIKQ